MTDQSYGIFASGAQAHRMEVKLDAVLQLLGVERTETHLILQQGHVLMANIDDLEADEAQMKIAFTQLLAIAGSLSAQVAALKNNPGVPADVQAKIDDLGAKFHDDIATLTAGISADGAPLNPTDPNQLPTPFISGIDPTSGPTGTPVTITGRDFTGITGVTVGGVSAVTFAAPDAQTVTATIPDGVPVGDTTILVSTSQGNSNAGAFSVTAAAPAPAPAA